MVIDINPYFHCSDPYAAREIIAAIVKVESGGNPWAININSKNGTKLLYQAKTEEQAKAWVRWFVQNGYNIDIGLGQINIKNIQKNGINPELMLEPCANLTMAGQILKSNYIAAAKTSSNTDDAVKKAISAYNTGNFRNGFSNGYVGKVLAKYNGEPIKKSTNYAMTPPLSNYQNGNSYKKIVIKNKYAQNQQIYSNDTNTTLAMNKNVSSLAVNKDPLKIDLWGGSR